MPRLPSLTCQKRLLGVKFSSSLLRQLPHLKSQLIHPVVEPVKTSGELRPYILNLCRKLRSHFIYQLVASMRLLVSSEWRIGIREW